MSENTSYLLDALDEVIGNFDEDHENAEGNDNIRSLADVTAELIRIRRETGLNRLDFSRQIGISPPSLARIESMHYGKVNVQTLQKLADALGFKLRIELFREPG
jgi:ribosome-binding protein aMBF1 (putative translation factor)